MADTHNTVTYVPFTGMLFITFLVLKLTGVIAWSWWWVTAPLWMPLALMLVLLVIFLLVGLVGFVTVGDRFNN